MKIAGVIIMGGKNTRMNGRKKAFLDYNGKPFYQHIAEALESTEKIYLSVENPYPYKNIEHELICDEYSGIGPIGGLYSVLNGAKYDAYVVLPSDTPMIDRRMIECMMVLCKAYNKTVVLKENGNINPLIAVYTKSCFPIVKSQIMSKNYKLMDLFNKIDYEVFDAVKSGFDVSTIFNCNDIQKYNELVGNTEKKPETNAEKSKEKITHMNTEIIAQSVKEAVQELLEKQKK